jgi:hypothetical protein
MELRAGFVHRLDYLPSPCADRFRSVWRRSRRRVFEAASVDSTPGERLREHVIAQSWSSQTTRPLPASVLASRASRRSRSRTLVPSPNRHATATREHVSPPHRSARNVGVDAYRATCHGALVGLFDDRESTVRQEAGTCFEAGDDVWVRCWRCWCVERSARSGPCRRSFPVTSLRRELAVRQYRGPAGIRGLARTTEDRRLPRQERLPLSAITQ